MHLKTTLATVTAILMTLSPAATATWMVAQSYEPDTVYDTPTWMWKDPPAPGEKKVYFNVVTFSSDWAATGVSYNPNVGALHTRNEGPNGEFHEAVLGIWKDCNGDGYIGMAETAVREYRSELLLDLSVCPPATGSVQKWTGVSHNYNGLVSELIPISRDVTVRDTRVLEDESAKVWGDFDKPDQAPERGSCALRPLPRGTVSSTGGMLNYVDCRVDILGGTNTLVDAAGDPLGLRFADDNDARTGTLGSIAPFGSEDSSNSFVHVQDCSSAPIARSGDLLNQTGLGEPTSDETGGGPSHNTEIRAPGSVGDPTTATVPGQYNATREELIVAESGTAHDCDGSNDRGADFYGTVESDNSGVDPRNKHEANWNFFFTTSNRGGAPVTLINGGNSGMNENDLGIGWGGSRWIADSTWATKPGFGIVKTDLTTAQVGPADAYWLTFYAFVGTNVTSSSALLPGPAAGAKYGSAQCGSQPSGIHNGWNCDITTWYMNADGTAQQGFSELERTEFASLGQTYNLRDVDCYDGSNDLGVALQPAGFGNAPCA